jgi:GntR family transcriptional regulator/MocR family aminotransferase
MRRWELSIALDPARELPIFLQLAGAIADDIRQGRLRPGDVLPGSRELAARLGVNRNTVVASYDELAAEGLVRTRAGGGTFIAEPPPQPPAAPAADRDRPTYALPPLVLPPVAPAPAAGLLMLHGAPDTRLFPARVLARAFRRAIELRGRALLATTHPAGHMRLRVELAAMLARTRALSVTPDNLLITRSIEQAIDLVARTLIAPGDAVAVEAFGYPPAWSVLRLAGARLLPVAVDGDGLDVDALEALLREQPLRAVFLTPHHQFPTTTVMSLQRRQRLAELALRHGFAIIEDDYDHEFHYEGRPILPIAAGSGGANAIYVGSLSHLLAPGVSTGFVVAPPAMAARLLSLRAASDARGDAAMECALAELFEDGELLRHARRMRQVYASRRDAMADALRRHLGGALRFSLPKGGLGLWASADRGIDVARWSRDAQSEGVLFFDAARYDFRQQSGPYMRLGFSYHDAAELDEAVRRMAKALRRQRLRRIGLPG